MDDEAQKLAVFEAERGRLRALASRMLASGADADDAVQEAWLRLSRADTRHVADLASWLRTVVSRICLDMLRARARRRATSIDGVAAEPPEPALEGDPEDEVVLADAVGLALLVVLDELGPAERVALVLHDVFGVPYEDVAVVVGRNAVATRQLASRARRRVRGLDAPAASDRVRQATVVEAFLAAARRGDLPALLEVLDPDVELRADADAEALGAPGIVRGADAVGGFLRRARGAQGALLDGEPGAVWAPGGEPRVLLHLDIEDGRIVRVTAVADRAGIEGTDLVVVGREVAR